MAAVIPVLSQAEAASRACGRQREHRLLASICERVTYINRRQIGRYTIIRDTYVKDDAHRAGSAAHMRHIPYIPDATGDSNRNVGAQKFASFCKEARFGAVRHGWTVIDESVAVTVRDGHISCFTVRRATASWWWGTNDYDSALRGVVRCLDVQLA